MRHGWSKASMLTIAALVKIRTLTSKKIYTDTQKKRLYNQNV